MRAAARRIGRYELVRVLGRGGMGEVWEAVLHGPRGYRRPVALKLLRSGPSHDQDRDALVHEARLGSLLNHPNVVATYELGRAGDTWFLAMELVDGPSLSVLARQAPIAPAALVELGIQACAGLGHIHGLRVAGHAAGLVHRDVKPQNILVDRNGTAKLADLGVAAFADGDVAVAGTPGFMAPEQADGRPEARSDLFALGVTLLAIVARRPPFGTGWSAVSVARDVERQLATAGFLDPADEAVPGLGGVLRGCLRLRPEDRFPDANALRAALEALRPAARGRLQLPGWTPPPSPTPGATPELSNAATVLVSVGNLPPPRDRFLGREAELDAIADAVGAGRRLVVLVGPGGMGKSRLALEAARRLGAHRRGGPWFFDLSDAHTAEDICFALARALELRLEPRDPSGQVGQALRRKERAIVVLDNLEQCVDALPETVGRWVADAPEVAFLATSRIRTKLPEESVVPVGSLSPALAEALLVERAPAAAGAERTELDALLADLDGVPLAIELCAARLGTVPLSHVRRHLADALGAGAPGDATRPVRHRSLEASLAWSASLLPGWARSALAQLSVCEGGFDLRAAAAVVELSHWAEAGWVLDVLQELVEANLLRLDPRSGRFSMLLVVQVFAAGLAPEERAAAEVRHGRHFAGSGLPEALAPVHGPGAGDLVAALSADADNLIAACRRAVRRNDATVAVQTCAAAWEVLRCTGPFATAIELADGVVAMRGLPEGDRAHALVLAGQARQDSGRGEEARAYYVRALAARRKAGDRKGEGEIVGGLANLDRELGRTSEARAGLEQALAIHREVGNRRAEGNVLANLGILDMAQGRYADAAVHLDASLAVHREIGNRPSEGNVLGNLGNLANREGRWEDALGWYALALPVLREVGNEGGVAMCLGNAGIVYRELGRVDEARAAAEAALATFRRLGNRRAEGTVLSNLATLDHAAGRLDEARRSCEDALTLAVDTGDRLFEAIAHGNLGVLEVDRGRPDAARVHLEQAATLHEATGDPRTGTRISRHLCGVEADAGRHDRAREVGERALASARTVGEPAAIGLALAELGRAHALAGALDAARACVDEALAVLGPVGGGPLGAAWCAVAEVERVAGRPEAAARALARAEAEALRSPPSPLSELARALRRARR